MTPPPHTMQLAGRADRTLTIAIHDAGEIYADCVDWHQIARLVQHGCPRSSPCASSADAGCEDPAQ